MLHATEREGRISAVKICPATPVVSHLFFADDSVILLKSNQQEAAALKEILDIYEQCSGHCINVEKSTLMFSPNTPTEARDVVRSTLQIRSENWNEKYLGLTVHVGRSRKRAFTFIKGALAG